MAKQLVPCSVCKHGIDPDDKHNRANAIGGYTCEQCLAEFHSATLPESPVAGDTARAMMRTLADVLMFTAPVSAELVSSGVRRCLDALVAGDLVAYTIEGFALEEALRAVRTAMGEATATLRAIQSLDPQFVAAVNKATLPVAIRDYRRRFVGKDDLSVITTYARHMLECSHSAECIETAAIIAELRSRKIEIPK